MADVFLLLADDERRKALVGAAQQLGRSAQALEKDVWVCWALQQLWDTPNAGKMAFKGGTSLSKVYDAIERFSEDVDVTLDYRSLDPDFDPFAMGISKNKLKMAGERLRVLVATHVHNVIVPHLRARLTVVGEEARPLTAIGHPQPGSWQRADHAVGIRWHPWHDEGRCVPSTPG